MSYFNLKFRVDFLGHVKNIKINILFFTVYLLLIVSLHSPEGMRITLFKLIKSCYVFSLSDIFFFKSILIDFQRM